MSIRRHRLKKSIKNVHYAKDLKIKEINYGYPFKGSGDLILSDEVYYKAMLDNNFLVYPRPIEVKKAISIIWEFKQ